MVVTDALGQATTIVSSLASGRPTSVTDPLGRTTGFAYDGDDRLTRTTAPEGNHVEHSYDARGNVTRTVAVPKGGGGPTIVTSASFDPACANPVTCNRPNNTTDARGNITVYEYDDVHGGVTRITHPAPTPNAVQPQTRYAYTLTDGAYRLTGVSQCRTTASCAGTADEVKTTLAYDDLGRRTSLTLGNGVVTTYAYDTASRLSELKLELPGTSDDLTSTFAYNPASQIARNVRSNDAYSWSGHGSGTTTTTANGQQRPELIRLALCPGSWSRPDREAALRPARPGDRGPDAAGLIGSMAGRDFQGLPADWLTA